MLYELAHMLQDRVPLIWDAVEWGNSVLFRIRYGRRLKAVPAVLERYCGEYRVREAAVEDVPALVDFFARQPEEAYTFFRPHKFDSKTIRKLIRRRSHLFFVMLDGEKVVGYYFLRCFFIGKAYLGKMADTACRGRGIGRMMCLSAMDVAVALGIRMFETISKDNPASLQSTRSVLAVRIVKEMENNYICIEDMVAE